MKNKHWTNPELDSGFVQNELSLNHDTTYSSNKAGKAGKNIS
jgi:hypothetical protein